jgi:hypothetical protein
VIGIESLALGKAKHWQSPTMIPADIVDEKQLPSWLGRHERAVLDLDSGFVNEAQRDSNCVFVEPGAGY